MLISLTESDHYDSKISKVIQFEKKQSLNFLSARKSWKNYISGTFWIFASKFQIIYAATYITVFLPLIIVSFICSIRILESVSTMLSFSCFYFTFFFLIYWLTYTFNNLATIFNSISLQHPHSIVQFHYNTSHNKYLLNCK